MLFHSGCTNLYPHQHCTKAASSLHFSLNLFTLVFLIKTIFTGGGDVALWFWFVFSL